MHPFPGLAEARRAEPPSLSRYQFRPLGIRFAMGAAPPGPPSRFPSRRWPYADSHDGRRPARAAVSLSLTPMAGRSFSRQRVQFSSTRYQRPTPGLFPEHHRNGDAPDRGEAT
jgi:hypothetical protein